MCTLAVRFLSSFLKGADVIVYLICIVKDYKDYRGPPNFEGLKPTNFGHWHYIFERCLTDLSEMQSGRPCLERWWDALKKVMRLHNNETLRKQAISMGRGDEEDINEIEHYYVYIK